MTLASTLALIAGELLSPRRWYWAVLAAFVVFSRTSLRVWTNSAPHRMMRT
ncbi:MAG: hypothetical protein GIX03_13715 [Candidatus Eremiobacteraeota bacterium]|nr:hypothetical protein [Candidatus Eremiobacteraeota bacterium]MBC5804023.1 hypothetical protein [Candidatus Eremiobacteraeota bacterium]MBC5820422.1 hypothetical protein [Candidatus Eremiobacteraeota bacterium]